MKKLEFIKQAMQSITNGSKLQLVKLVYDISKDAEIEPRIGLKEAKDFVDEHYFPNTRANAEKIWNFSKGKINADGSTK